VSEELPDPQARDEQVVKGWADQARLMYSEYIAAGLPAALAHDLIRDFAWARNLRDFGLRGGSPGERG
jgi:hypothetical protein